MHYGQMESADFMLCNTFNGQLFRDGQHCNVFLAGAQECWVARRLIASLLPHTNMLPGWSLWTWWSDFMNVLKLDSSLALIFACVCVCQVRMLQLQMPPSHLVSIR